ncbi:CHAT domain-containing protein [Prochlorothrix hollandica]|uniref:CHAT domain-containing protein n=1 Tax=Prochlorothrix hollandica TaxID=1223 RepID=UPI000349E792|nr:CHAT domain-containing protein [Prochlorothrix hollandica]
MQLTPLLLLSLSLSLPIGPALSRDSPLAPTSPVPTSSTPALTLSSPSPDRGLGLYQAGQYRPAIDHWQQQLSNAYPRDQASLHLNIGHAQIQLGLWQAAAASLNTSQTLLQALPPGPDRTFLQARTHQGQGHLAYAQGHLEQAQTDFANATQAYRSIGDLPGQYQSQLNHAKVLHSQGYTLQAEQQLEDLAQGLGNQAPSGLTAETWRELGNLRQFTQGLEQAQADLAKSWAIASQLQDSPQLALTAFDQGNLLYKQWLQDYGSNQTESLQTKAEAAYKQALTHSHDPGLHLQVWVNRWYFQSRNPRLTDSEAADLRQSVEAAFAAAPRDRASLRARISDTLSLLDWQQAHRIEPNFPDLAQRLAEAITGARQLQDKATESYGLGHLATLYRQTQDLDTALNLTQQALTLAQTLNATEILYRWQWQQGQILQDLGQLPEAEKAYEAAIASLELLRADLASLQGETRFSFREEVEPVYREYMRLLLTRRPDVASSPDKPATVSQNNLIGARKAIESLQLAELVNFFQANCVSVQEVAADQIDPKAGIIYTILLEDRLEILLSQPNQEIYHASVPVQSLRVEHVAQDMILRLRTSMSGFQKPSQALYDWLIRPLEATLSERDIERLVFVLDGSLRNIPMAVLHDGEQYLLEQYAIAVTPGLQLFEPTPLSDQVLTASLVGLSEARQGFTSLPNVALEIAAIEKELPATIFFNEDFQESVVAQQIIEKPTPIVHFATHGQFSSKAEDNFILTWDDKINIEELSQLLQGGFRKEGQAIELLVFSACETAAGDDRAVLGLAGLAVRSGARSTLATLWQVSDQGTAVFMAELYQQLAQRGVSKAEAVRRAQLAMIQDHGLTHPFYWAPFILVGNWL